MLMNITFESKGDFKETRKWLDSVSKHTPLISLSQIAIEGKQNLALNTPKDTGITAAGWEAEIRTTGFTSEISWTNRAHPGVVINLAKLIDQGYGTGTGGYVAPRPYIKQSMEPVWKTAGDKIYKELID